MPLSDYSNLTILLTDVEPLFQRGLKNILKNLNFPGSILDVKSGKEVLHVVEERYVDLIILDFKLPKVNGYETASRLLKINPSARIIIMSSYSDQEFISHIHNLGVLGFIDKNGGVDQVEKSLFQVLDFPKCERLDIKNANVIKNAGDPIHFTKREKEVIKFLSRGLTSELIAQELNLSPNTIETYRCRLLNKVNVKNTSELLVFTHKNRILNES